jgi:hypothetical protein
MSKPNPATDTAMIRVALLRHEDSPDLTPEADVLSHTLPWWVWDRIHTVLSGTTEGKVLADILYPASNEELSDVAHIIDPDCCPSLAS